MVAQLSPAMLSRLEDLIGGGMTLPQAAKSLLSDSGLSGHGGGFAQLMEAKTLTVGQMAVADPQMPGSELGSRVVPPLQNLPAGTMRPVDGFPLVLPTTVFAAVAPTGQPLTGQEFPKQLANSLLDMGVPQPVATKGWGSAIGERLMWMVKGDRQAARLKLNPPNLGPLEVRVSVNQDQTSVSFLASQAAVRDALEAALPRLREMFDQQSLQLVRADVSDPGMQHGDRTQDSPSHGDTGKGQAGFGDSGEADEAVANAHQGPIQVSDQLVDLFV
jgi:flagellar hook-length control protein FliK